MKSALEELLLGSLPGLEPSHRGRPFFVAPKPKHPNARKWSRLAIAKRAGVDIQTLYKTIREDEETRRILGLGPGEHGLTTKESAVSEAQARAVIERVFATRALGDINKRWSLRLGFEACIVCGKTDSKHHSQGECCRCYNRNLSIALGDRVRPFPDAWDKERGNECCTICLRGAESGLKHCSNGRCAPCWQWSQRAAIDVPVLNATDANERERLIKQRRKRVQTNGDGRARKPKCGRPRTRST